MRDATGDDVAHDELRDRLRAALAERYAVGEEIGSGASAVVFAARDLLHFERDVALKVIRPEVVVAVGVARFRREMQLAAQLNHPHILPLLDWGDVDGLLYYVMPRVRGESLRGRLQREQQLALDEAVRITRDIAGALQHAHGHGIAHRDVKPENILLVEGEASLGDFGLAREVERRAGEPITASGIAVGTAMYMSPEQASGGGGNARSDQYSLACVLYEMLAGDPPFHASTVQGMLARHRADAAPRLTTVRPSLPAGVDEALQRALAKVPAERFANVSQFATAVETALTGATLAAVRAATPAASPPVAEGRAIRWQRAALGVLAVAALVWWVVKSLEVLPGDRTLPLDANRLAVAPFDVFDPADSLWKEGLMDLLSRSLDDAGPIRTAAPSTIVKAWSGRADIASATALGKRLGAGVVVFGQFLRLGGDSVRVNASLVQTAAERPTEVEVRDEASRPDRIVDSLSVRILRILGETRQIAAVPKASLGSRSFSALKAFLQGEQYYRRNNFGLARGHYENAIRLDSTFALAHRRMRGVLRALAVETDSLSLWYAARAGDLNHGLPARDSLLIVADSLAAAVGLPGSLLAESTYRLLSRRLAVLQSASVAYPDDPEIWFELGEAQLHIGYRFGISADRVLTTFERSIALDPQFTPGYFHAIELAIGLEGADGARPHVDRHLAANPGDRRVQLIRDLIGQDPGARERALRAALGLPGDTAWRVAHQLRRFHDSSGVGRRLVQMLAESNDPRHAAATTNARVWRPFFQIYEGRLNEALQAVDFETLFAGDPTALTLLVAHGVLPDSAGRTLFERLRASTNASDWILATSWYGARRDSSALRHLITQFENAARAPSSHRAASGYGPEAARAYLALSRGDSVGALANFGRVADSLCAWPCLPDRLETARLLASAGRVREAAAALDRVPPSPDAHLLGEVFWALARARLALRLGDRVAAERWYRLVASAWATSDSGFRSAVAEATAFPIRQRKTG